MFLYTQVEALFVKFHSHRSSLIHKLRKKPIVKQAAKTGDVTEQEGPTTTVDV